MSNQLESQIGSEGSSSAVSLGTALHILRKRKWMIAGIVVTIPLLVAYIVGKEPKVYETSTSLVIESSVPQYLGQNFRDVVEMESNWWSAQETMQTELRVLKSFSQAQSVAKALCSKFIGHEHVPALTRLLPGANCNDPADYARAAPIIQGLLRVEQVKESRLVNLVVDSSDPDLAAMLANTAAQSYVERNLERRLSQSEGAATWLGDEYGDLTVQLNEAERALIDFKRKNNVIAVGIEDQQNDLSSKRKKLDDELNTIQVRLIAVKAQRDQFASLKTTDPMTDVSPGVADSPVMEKLKELYVDQYAKLLEMRGKYLEKHPAVIAQEARVDAIKSDLKREAGLASKNVEAQYQTLVKQEHDLKAALDSATHEALQLEQRAIEYNRLRRNFDRLSKLSDQVGGRERETSLAGHLKTNNVRILDAAMVPTVAIAPNVPRTVGGAVVVALLLALALAVLLEFLDFTVKTQEDVEKTIGVSFLGLIPTIVQEPSGKSRPSPAGVPVADMLPQGSKDLWVLSHPKSSVAECCRAIRTNILFMSPDKPAKSLLITSAGPQEGKTTTAVNLAISMAQSGLRVLLVDSDMRRPRLHKAFGMPSTADGLSKAIVGDAEVLTMVKETGVPNLWLLPCGATPPNPAELLHAERFKRIVAELTDHFDRVIFDSPPVGAVTDAKILSRLTAGTVLVAKGGRTSKDALLRTRRQLSDGDVNVLGCILNDLDLSRPGSYAYYYYSRYGYYYYHDDENPQAPPAATPKGQSARPN